jgi:hypothetical protein
MESGLKTGRPASNDYDFHETSILVARYSLLVARSSFPTVCMKPATGNE